MGVRRTGWGQVRIRARCRPHDARGRLRSQRPALALVIAASGLDPEELLLDDVGDRADAALEDVRLLEEGRLDGLVAVVGGEVAGELFEPANAARSWGRRSRVPRASGAGHRPESSRAVRRGRPASGSAVVALDRDDVLELLQPRHDPRQLGDRGDLEGGLDGGPVVGLRRTRAPR